MMWFGLLYLMVQGLMTGLGWFYLETLFPKIPMKPRKVTAEEKIEVKFRLTLLGILECFLLLACLITFDSEAALILALLLPTSMAGVVCFSILMDCIDQRR